MVELGDSRAPAPRHVGEAQIPARPTERCGSRQGCSRIRGVPSRTETPLRCHQEEEGQGLGQAPLKAGPGSLEAPIHARLKMAKITGAPGLGVPGPRIPGGGGGHVIPNHWEHRSTEGRSSPLERRIRDNRG
jgi:hypothetical protein